MRARARKPLHHLTIRDAQPADITAMREIEQSAGEMFLLVDMPEIAADPAPVRRVYRNAITRKRAWLALYQGWPAGYLIAKDLDGNLYLDQLSVDPDFARKGIGAALIDYAEQIAKDSGLPRMTMFTFAHVPWNAPYYQRLGFEQLPIEHYGPQLQRVLQAELAADLHRWSRVCLYRDV